METTMGLLPKTAASGIPSLPERQAATLAVLDSFMEQDEDEHRETLRVLRQSLDEDWHGQRRIFGAGAVPK